MKNNQSGFGLIQVVIAASLMSVISLGMAGLMTNQAQQISYMEDRMSYNNFKGQLAAMLELNAENCTASLAGIKLNTATPQRPANIQIKDKDGNVLFDANDKTKNHVDKVKIDSIKVEDIDVASGGTGSGQVKITVNPVRMRKGGGPTEMMPIEIIQQVTADTGSNNEVLDCVGGSTGMFENCVVKDLTGGMGTSVKKKCGRTTSMDAISFKVPSDTVVFEADGIGTIYPGVTKVNGRVLPKGGVYKKYPIGQSGYDHTTSGGNQYWKYGCDYEVSYAGIVFYRYEWAGNGGSKSPRPRITNYHKALGYDSKPSICPSRGRVNSRVPASTTADSTAYGVTLYKDDDGK